MSEPTRYERIETPLQMDPPEAPLTRAFLAAHDVADQLDRIEGTGTAVLHKLAYDIRAGLALFAEQRAAS